MTLFSEEGPQFHLIKFIIVSNKVHFVPTLLYDCFFEEHLQAYKIFYEACYSYAVLDLSDITYNTHISIRNKLADGYDYIAKH